ncbi:DNA repair protein RAD51-like 4 [Exaiptasia diaphana]|nr:DNA repair protein RAD51-like 4 [Exaiptasia diaphana]
MQKILRDCSVSLRETLRSHQIKTVASLLTCDSAKITSQTDDKKELQSIQHTVLNQFSCFPLSGRSLLDDVMSSFFILPTGCTQ